MKPKWKDPDYYRKWYERHREPHYEQMRLF
jgi:hypothetical protein